MPTLYHISDYPALDNVSAGDVLHLTPESAWSWGRDNQHRNKTQHLYTVWAPWPSVQVKNDRYVARQVLTDVVITPYGPDPPARNPAARVPEGPPRRRKDSLDRFTSKDPLVPATPPSISTEPPGRILRGPHNMNMMDMVRTVARLRRLSASLRKEY